MVRETTKENFLPPKSTSYKLHVPTTDHPTPGSSEHRATFKESREPEQPARLDLENHRMTHKIVNYNLPENILSEIPTIDVPQNRSAKVDDHINQQIFNDAKNMLNKSLERQEQGTRNFDFILPPPPPPPPFPTSLTALPLLPPPPPPLAIGLLPPPPPGIGLPPLLLAPLPPPLLPFPPPLNSNK